MGYDVDLIGSLLEAMRRSKDELDGIRTSDPEGVAAASRVAAATGTLNDHWIPFLRSLLSCSAMTGYTPASIADGDLANSWLNSLVHGGAWRTSTDPLAMADEPMSFEQAAQLAVWLSDHGDDLDAELDDREVIDLDQQLAEIAAVPSLASAFLANLTPAGLTNLVDELGGRRAGLMIMEFGGGLTEQQVAEVATIDAAMVDLAGIIVMCSADNPYATPTGQLVSEMDPYAASLLVRNLQLGADDLAAVAAALIEREQQDVSTAAYVCGVRAADILMTTILATADGPSRFVVAVADSPGLLLSSAHDPHPANQILLAGTVPTVLSPSEQAAVIPSFIDYIIEITARPVEPYADHNLDIFEVTGALMAPYLVQLFDSANNPLLAGEEMQQAWNFIFDNPALLQYFVDERGRMTLASTEPLGVDLAADRKTLLEFSTLLGLLDGLYEQGEVRVAERDRAEWELSWSLLDLLPDILPIPGVAQAGGNLALLGLQQLLDRAGWAPAEVEQVRIDAVHDISTKKAIVASIVAGSMFRTFVEQGRIPPQTPPPPVPDVNGDRVALSYVESMQEWAGQVDVDAETIWLVLAASDQLLNPYEAAKNGAPSYDDG